MDVHTARTAQLLAQPVTVTGTGPAIGGLIVTGTIELLSPRQGLARVHVPDGRDVWATLAEISFSGRQAALFLVATLTHSEECGMAACVICTPNDRAYNTGARV
jgi:hypothetical protein